MNSVCKKLENGNGTIAGMEMLYPVEDGCLIQVKVIGIYFGGYNSGVSVKIEPLHGVGFKIVSATDLVDDTQKALSNLFKAAKLAATQIKTGESWCHKRGHG